MGLRFLYRLVRRAFDLVVLRFRVVDEKDIEILVLRHQSPYCPARSADLLSMTLTGRCWPPSAGCSLEPVGGLLWSSRRRSWSGAGAW